MDSGILAILGKLGSASGLAVIAWLFWERSHRVALFCLIFAVVAGVGIVTSEVMNAWTSYTVELSPPPNPKWGGVYETGEYVESISATLFRNGKPTEKPKKVGPLDFANRALRAELDQANVDRLLVMRNDYLQGYVPIQSLGLKTSRLNLFPAQANLTR